MDIMLNQKRNRRVDNIHTKDILDINITKKELEAVNETEKDIRIPIIEDIKNVDNNPLGFTIDSMRDKIMGENATNKKINIAFLYSTLSANGIGRVITVTSKYLLKTGKYNIIFITEKPYYKEFSYDASIKRFYAYNKNSIII